MGAKGAGLAFDAYADNGETVEEPDGHAYSRGTFQAAKDDGKLLVFDLYEEWPTYVV